MLDPGVLTGSYALGVGGVVVRVRSGAAGPRLEPSAASLPFLTGAEPADSTLDVAWRELAEDPPGELVFDTGGSWRLYRRGDRDVYRFFDSSLGAVPYKEAEVCGDAREGRVLLDPRFHPSDEPVDPLLFPLDELLFLRLLGARGAVELHACGVVTASGEGLAFVGQSGDGKSTTARLWEGEKGAAILSDDRLVVRRDHEDHPRIYGTPWHGEAGLASSRRAPLAAAFVLARGERSALEPLAPAEATSLLLARSFPSFHDAAQMSRTLELLESVVASVPCFRFPFLPGPDAVRAVKQLLSARA